MEDNKFWDPLMHPVAVLDTTSKKARQRHSARRKKQNQDRAAQRDGLVGLEAPSFAGNSALRCEARNYAGRRAPFFSSLHGRVCVLAVFFKKNY